MHENIERDSLSESAFKGTHTNFEDNFEKPKDVLITGDTKILVQFRLKLPNLFSETIIKCVWLRIARMRMAAT